MQTKVFLCAALFSAIALVSAEPAPQPEAQTTSTPSAAQSKASHDLDVYIASITAASQWPSVSAAVFKGIPFALSDLLVAPIDLITTNPMFSDLPKQDQDFVISANKAAGGIISKDLSGDAAKPTGTGTAMATGMTTGITTGMTTGTATGTATGAGVAVQPTGAVMAAGAAAAGLLGVIAML